MKTLSERNLKRVANDALRLFRDERADTIAPLFDATTPYKMTVKVTPKGAEPLYFTGSSGTITLHEGTFATAQAMIHAMEDTGIENTRTLVERRDPKRDQATDKRAKRFGGTKHREPGTDVTFYVAIDCDNPATAEFYSQIVGIALKNSIATGAAYDDADAADDDLEDDQRAPRVAVGD